MNLLYTDLQWLPTAPADFSASLKALANSTPPLGSELQRLASHGLDLNQLTKLASAFDKARSDGKSLQPLTPFRLALLSNSTIDLIVPALVASALRHGIALEVIKPHYDQAAQEACAAKVKNFRRHKKITSIPRFDLLSMYEDGIRFFSLRCPHQNTETEGMLRPYQRVYLS